MNESSYDESREKVIADAGSPAQALANLPNLPNLDTLDASRKRDPWRTEMTKDAMGGTEMQMTALYKHLGEEYLSDFQIIPSRLVELDENKWRVLWCHDLATDPQNDHLKNGGWRKFHSIVFVSNWQKEQYLSRYNIPPSKTVVIQNAIEPITQSPDKSNEQFRMIYHTTPHRGLEILVPVFEKLYEKFGNKIHLDVFSSFKIYGWDGRDQPFEPLFDKIKNHDGMTYHSSQPNEVVRDYLATKSHCFAYPSIWPETSCISLLEAMDAGLLCIHPNLAALPETGSNWTFMYNFHEVPNDHARNIYGMLEAAIENHFNNDEMKIRKRLENQAAYISMFYSWNIRKLHWKVFLDNVKTRPKPFEKGGEFVFSTNNPHGAGFID